MAEQDDWEDEFLRDYLAPYIEYSKNKPKDEPPYVKCSNGFWHDPLGFELLITDEEAEERNAEWRKTRG